MYKISSIIIFYLASFGCLGGGISLLKIHTGPPPAVQTAATLRVQAALYFGEQDEEVEPVEADFYLLDESLIAILKRARFKPVFADGIKRRAKDEDYLEAAAKVFLSESNDVEAQTLVRLINEAIMGHQASFVRTKQSGRGYFKTLKPGKYYLFGIKQIADQVVVWHLPISVKSGPNSIELDQSNAATVFSSDH